VHILTDGRDVPDGSSIKFTEELEEVLKELEVGCRCGGVMGVVQKEVAALPGGAAWNGDGGCVEIVSIACGAARESDAKCKGGSLLTA
jgi:hypothetical protein